VTGVESGAEEIPDLLAARFTEAGQPDLGFSGDGVIRYATSPDGGFLDLDQHGRPVIASTYSRVEARRFTGDVPVDEGGGDGGGTAGEAASSGRGLEIHKLVSPRTLPKLFSSGVRALVSCELDCRAILEVKVPKGAAEEMGLSTRVVARGSRVLEADRKRWVIARLTGQARRALRTYTGGGRFKVSARGTAP
jgi:hypothetical protein